MNKRNIILAFVLGTLAIFVIPTSVFAEIPTSIVPACMNNIGGCTLCDIWPLANNIINFLLFGLAIPVLTVVLIWGGVMWTTAGASPGNIEQGKKIMTSGIIGILIAFAGWLIVDTVIKTLASGGSMIIAWQDFRPDDACINENLKNEQFTFQDLIPGGNQVQEDWLLKQCNSNYTACTVEDYNNSGKWNPIAHFATVGECEEQGRIRRGKTPDFYLCVKYIPPPGDYYSDTEARTAFQAAGIAVKSNFCDQNQPLPSSQCPDPRPSKSGSDPKACTSLDRIPKRTLDNLKKIVGIPFYISGGTEYGHQTHMPCAPVVDIVPGTPGSPNYALLGTLRNATLEAAGGISPNTRCETQGGTEVSSCLESDGANHVHVKFQ